LIVDDVETNIYVAKGLLTPYELSIDSADSGFTAIEKIGCGNSYDIIFMDHMMPKMDGLETTKRLRDIGYRQPIVALTANAVAGQADIFLKNGFDDFISKPIDIRHLNIILNKFIRDKQPPEVIETARRQAREKKRQAAESAAVPDTRLKRVEIDGLNIADGLEYFGGNEESYLNILRSYATNTRKLLTEIDTFDNAKIEDYEITVHGIKGSSYGICAESLGDLAEALENAAKAKDFDFIRINNRPFLDAAWRLVDCLDDLFSVYDSNSSKMVKDKPDKEDLLRLHAACDAFDMSEVEVVMEKIDCCQYESDDGLVDWLRKNVELVNYDEIVQKLSGVK
jgi:CheY-like chemotaxis protein